MKQGIRAFSVLLALAGYMALCAPLVSAEPPDNDNFADAQALLGTLPIAAAGSNVGAGPEAGEPPSPFGEAAGHSVWFKWTAAVNGWVTIATCGSGFGSVVDAYTGGTLASLEKVSRWKEGPRRDCAPAGSQTTFRAVSGTNYWIRVDGNLSPQAPAAKEGAIALQIALTPTPANDNFAQAQTVTAEALEDGAFYRVDVPGFNWNATKEAGEPEHAGDSGGASVWFSWTAPVSGNAEVVVAAAALDPRVGVYTGDSVSALIPLATTSLFPSEVEFPVSAGTTYRFAVDGRLDSGLPSMGQFTFLIYTTVPPPVVQQSVPFGTAPLIADLTAPTTTILRRSIKPGKRKATFRFRSGEAGGSFLCRLDTHREAPCRSPKTYAGLAPGPHAFKVRALDAAGNADLTPATARFSIAAGAQGHR